MTKNEFLEYIDSFEKDCGEFTDDELYEIGVRYKEEIPLSEKNWQELVELLEPRNTQGEIKTAEAFRGWIKAKQKTDGTLRTAPYAEFVAKQLMGEGENENTQAQVAEVRQESYKGLVKIRDEYNAYRRNLRDEARIESFKDLISETAKNMGKIEFSSPIQKSNSGKEAVLLFSDLHIGAVFENFYNKYNKEVAIHRVNKLVNDTIRYCEENNVDRLNFCNLGDLIHGAIHLSARVENQEDRVEEIMTASEIVAQALVKLSDNIPEVIYRSTIGNHDRMTSNVHESIEKENFVKIIDWYLESRLASTNIIFKKDNLDDSLGVFELMNGKTAIFVHGHQDKNVNKSLLGLSNYLDRKINYFFMGHFHSANVSAIQGSTIITNGSIMGVDGFAESIRAFGPPTQTLVIFDNTNNVQNITIDLNIV